MCTPFSLTKNNFEIQLQTNYISPFYLTKLLLPTLLSTAKTSPPSLVRIVNVSSDGHSKLAPKNGFNFTEPNLENFSTWTRYGQSKFAMVAHAKELARRYPSILSVSLHPGTVKTELSKKVSQTSWWYKYVQPLIEFGAPGPEEGAWGVLWCAASRELPELGERGNGAYFEKVGKLGRPNNSADNEELVKKLWSWTEEGLIQRGF
jgi:NAD(P)-dependent dehydrogenase (short-subunit alcohol dehydrogenase family)